MLVRSWSTGTLPFILEPVFHPHLVRREHMYQYIIHVGVAVAGGVGLHFNSDPNPSKQELWGSVDGIVIVVLWLQTCGRTGRMCFIIDSFLSFP